MNFQAETQEGEHKGTVFLCAVLAHRRTVPLCSDVIDEQSLAQALADYYYSNGKSFDGLRIAPQYADRFNSIKDWAVEFYTYE